MKRNVTTQEPNSQKTITPKLAQRSRVLTSGLDEHIFRYSLRTRRHIAYRNGKRLISLGDTLIIRSLHTLCSIRRHGSAQRQQKAVSQIAMITNMKINTTSARQQTTPPLSKNITALLSISGPTARTYWAQSALSIISHFNQPTTPLPNQVPQPSKRPSMTTITIPHPQPSIPNPPNRPPQAPTALLNPSPPANTGT
jgi:hypothetical protein